ncbi:MAG: bifunctional riboflavin kinase/FAD synthetase [Candidatus Kapabacteria bacterium]|nr:bifunctional riboflavin kinase/FAD synthetase [Candidatus Kapabacteria bacterium]
MRIFYNFDETIYHRETIVTVGTFDGVHLGHKSVIKSLLDYSRNEDIRHVLVTFDPHPQLVLAKENKKPIKILTTLEEKFQLLEDLGVENVQIIPFSLDFAQIKPEIFVKEYLVDKIGINRILIGYDHLFGQNRSGNYELLQRLGQQFGFSVDQGKAFSDSDTIISSTRIRNAIEVKNLELANQMLGYDYFLLGEIVHGHARGAGLGYPTANVIPLEPEKLIPANGIYFISAFIGNRKYYGMANVGTRPTFENNGKILVEAFFFDFNNDIYDLRIQIEFIKYIREEIKFDNSEQLIEAIKQDEVICRNLINNFLD